MNYNFDIELLTQLRYQLHQNAELSNQELNTAKIIKAFISQAEPDTIAENIGGHGLVFEFKGSDPEGLKIGFRADIDALPIDESIDLPYGSNKKGVAHKCGHDGHSAIVAALASLVSNNKFKNTIYLIFQPAEEIGTGAKAVIQHFTKKAIKLDYIIGLHNLPGFETGKIIARIGTFAPASTGMIITLKGKNSHAAEPENGISPATAFSNIIQNLQIIIEKLDSDELALCTVIQASLGEIAFGTSPAYAEIRATLRANNDKDLAKLVAIAEEMVKQEATTEMLELTISYTESFPSTINSENAFNLIRRAAKNESTTMDEKPEPFKWSEDFGHYKKYTESVFFGLGAGINCPNLHNEKYDFPDEIILTGAKIYAGIINLLEDAKT